MTWFKVDDQFQAWLPDEAAEWMPLSEFSADRRQEVLDAVAAPNPPPRWRELCVDPATGRALLTIENRAWWEWYWARDLDPNSVRRKLPRWLRAEVIERDGLVCRLCGEEVEPADVHIDHVLPVARGGTDELGNLQVAHALCNMRKGARI